MTKTVVKESDKAVQVFEFNENLSVRTLIDKQGEPWFVAKDVAEALGYANPREAVRDHCKRNRPIRGSESLPPAESQTELVTDNSLDPQTVVIPEFDVYRLMMRSELKAAEKFQDWVFEKVLPSIRKHGHYVFMSNQAHMLPQSYDYFPVELLAAAAEMTVVDFNHVLYRHGLQEMSVDAQGRMIFRLTKKGKEHGIAQQSYEENGVKMPPRILWRRKMLGVPAFGFGHEAMKRLPA